MNPQKFTIVLLCCAVIGLSVFIIQNRHKSETHVNGTPGTGRPSAYYNSPPTIPPQTPSPPEAPPASQQPTTGDRRLSVLNYVATLKQFETEKQLMLTRQSSALDTMMLQMQHDDGNDQSAKQTEQNAQNTAQFILNNMRDLQSHIAALSVPSPCENMQQRYMAHIDSVARMMQAVIAEHAQLQSDVEQMNAQSREIDSQYPSHPNTFNRTEDDQRNAQHEALGNATQARVTARQNGLKQNEMARTNADILAADQALTTLCSQFQIPKDFKISTGG